MINFLKYRFISLILSVVLLCTGIVAYMTIGFKYSVDFTGGMEVLFRFKEPFSREQLKKALRDDGWDNVALRDFSKEETLVRIPTPPEGDLRHLAEKMHASIQKEFSNNPSEILEINSVGKGVGEELWKKSLNAILIALLLMLLYIAIRFKFAYSVGAVVALFHDAFAILTFFLLFQREISPSVIGAVLALLGYSVNDTIVIFTRIRENLAKKKKELSLSNIAEVINLSINQTLKRTLLTSFTTALVVGALFVLGGETLRSLSLAFLIGIVVGTYSSIYIASPVMLLLYREKEKTASH